MPAAGRDTTQTDAERRQSGLAPAGVAPGGGLAGPGHGPAGPGRWTALARLRPGRAGRGARGDRRRLARVAGVGVPGLAALLINLYQLAVPSLWRDEAYSIDAAARPYGQILALLRHTDAVNGTYYLLLHPVIAVLGTSAAAIRLPSVLAMAVAAAVTAAIGERLALLAGLPAPVLTGALAGLLLAAAPMATRYAQEARAYALVTMMATIASYLLVRALTDPRWRWWAGYALAVTVTGLFNLLALLLVAAHGITMLILTVRRRAALARSAGTPLRAGGAADAGGIVPRPGRWLAAVAAAGIVLSPLVVAGYLQRQQVGWLSRPGSQAGLDLIASFAGATKAILPMGLVTLGGVAAGLGTRRPAAVPPAAVALPWLALPPLVLLAVSQVKPLYDARYVIYCLPALALLAAAGLSWLARLAGRTALGSSPGAAWLPSLAVTVGLAALLVVPQQQVRMPSARPDNLRALSAVLAARERPGDGVLYLPSRMRVVSLGYPAPFRGLRDVALAQSPAAAANLIGADVPPAALRGRLAGLTRLWVVSGTGRHGLAHIRSRLGRTAAALLAGWRLAGHWPEGKVELRLYVRR